MERYIVSTIILIMIFMESCTQFLDVKPNSGMAIPDNVKDLQALLDNEDKSILTYPESGDIASDYYFLKEEDWLSRSLDARNVYVWDANAQYLRDWSNAYQKIFTANVVLENIDEASLGNLQESDRGRVKGTAYFIRGWNYFHLSQLFCPYYSVDATDSPYGLPLKISADINEPIERATLQETYERIIQDLTQAVSFLPDRVDMNVRPSKATAYAALARVNLVIGDYDNALAFANKSLELEGEILDYNIVDPIPRQPFEILNQDVLFHAMIVSSSGVHAQSRSFVDTVLIEKYDNDDLRKELFFRQEQNGYFRFRGTYEGGTIALFGGISIPEINLIKAECYARLGQDGLATEALNSLRVNRYRNGAIPEIGTVTGDSLLELILEEREKELLFRGGIRWSDLRRLNQDGRFAKTLSRKIGNNYYELKPNDSRYTFLIPFTVVQQSGLIQNPR